MKSCIIVINTIALPAAKYIYNEKKRELCEKFSLSFMRHAAKLCEDEERKDTSLSGRMCASGLPAAVAEGAEDLLSCLQERMSTGGEDSTACLRKMAEGGEDSQSYIREIGDGGILNALWYMNEELGSGMEIDLRKIPIRQETVEILELFNVNPYYAKSDGAWLLVTQDPVSVTEACEKAGLPCALIGHLTPGPARIIKNGDSVRYLDRPQEDALSVFRMQEAGHFD